MVHFPLKGESIWNHTMKPYRYGPLRHDMSIDVAVVGAGITGLTTAYLLKQAGYKVAVFEKYRIGDSISGHTTAKVTSQHGVIYAELSKRFDRETAKVYGEANETAISLIQDIISEEKIACGWRREDSYVYTTDKAGAADIVKEGEITAQLGLPSELVATIPLGLPVTAALKFRNQATFHIVKYLDGLASAVHGDGSYVFEDTKVTNIHDGHEVKFKIPKGTVRARHLVLATNIPSPLKDHAVYGLFAYPSRSYLIAANTNKNISGMYISHGDTTRSVLPTRIDGKHRLLIGGDGHMVGLGGPAKKHYRKLREFAHELGSKDITLEWSAWDYKAYDHLPIIGKLYSSSKNIYTATGYQKWGMTNGTVAAMIITDLITGVENPWAATFGNHRKHAAKAALRGLLEDAKLINPKL